MAHLSLYRVTNIVFYQKWLICHTFLYRVTNIVFDKKWLYQFWLKYYRTNFGIACQFGFNSILPILAVYGMPVHLSLYRVTNIVFYQKWHTLYIVPILAQRVLYQFWQSMLKQYRTNFGRVWHTNFGFNSILPMSMACQFWLGQYPIMDENVCSENMIRHQLTTNRWSSVQQ